MSNKKVVLLCTKHAGNSRMNHIVLHQKPSVALNDIPQSTAEIHEPQINGVFSSTSKITVGYGHTKKKTTQYILIYVAVDLFAGGGLLFCCSGNGLNLFSCFLDPLDDILQGLGLPGWWPRR